ncbi:MAG: ChbG/HpnK family deacetylase [Methylotenera sp.]|nr:ChbG/HpnK family deacetylase [Methylotenera sp.]
MQAIKKIIINADDFAQSAAIEAAIIDLAERSIIHSTSALVLSPRWRLSASKLANLPIQAGLHLDLTSHFTHEFGYYHQLPRLIASAYTNRLDSKRLESIIELQFDRFTDNFGRNPDFIDGHQHVHQLPVVRDALFSVIDKKNWGMQAENWLRICQTQYRRGLKAQLISALGASETQKLANKNGILTNSDFAGVYNFDSHTNLNILWERWLANLQGNFPVIMCHVAKKLQSTLADSSDSIYQSRFKEYAWLSSPEFKALLESKGYLS